MMKKNNIYFMITCALMAAIMCVFGPMSVPIGPIPVSLTNLVLYFTVFILGLNGTTVSFCVYLLLGLVGLPVFSGGAGGLGKIIGPTGGYLVGFIPMVIIMALIMRKFNYKAIPSFIGMVLGTIVAYVCGTAWFVYSFKCTLAYAMSVCVIPFIPFDIGKMVIAIILGTAVRKALIKANLIGEVRKNND